MIRHSMIRHSSILKDIYEEENWKIIKDYLGKASRYWLVCKHCSHSGYRFSYTHSRHQHYKEGQFGHIATITDAILPEEKTQQLFDMFRCLSKFM